ncbi:hypothetical protein AMELA_G00263800 [Ameiurus melas]|uniref:Uncharacterized protein n=1 Tax=Ameiurus melas TaxID=219545 RepID=A0A7J5ZPW0_AMEME|nr:hypothetical protein AMELA_G00263800 [Ameiurus melas]
MHGPCRRKTFVYESMRLCVYHTQQVKLCGLNIGHGTFGVGVKAELDVGRGHVSLLVLVPAHTSPAVTFILLNHVQHLAFCHRDGALVLT